MNQQPAPWRRMVEHAAACSRGPRELRSGLPPDRFVRGLRAIFSAIRTHQPAPMRRCASFWTWGDGGSGTVGIVAEKLKLAKPRSLGHGRCKVDAPVSRHQRAHLSTSRFSRPLRVQALPKAPAPFWASDTAGVPRHIGPSQAWGPQRLNSSIPSRLGS